MSGKGFLDKETLILGKISEGRIQRLSCGSVCDGQETRKMSRAPTDVAITLVTPGMSVQWGAGQ